MTSRLGAAEAELAHQVGLLIGHRRPLPHGQIDQVRFDQSALVIHPTDCVREQPQFCVQELDGGERRLGVVRADLPHLRVCEEGVGQLFELRRADFAGQDAGEVADDVPTVERGLLVGDAVRPGQFGERPSCLVSVNSDDG